MKLLKVKVEAFGFFCLFFFWQVYKNRILRLQQWQRKISHQEIILFETQSVNHCHGFSTAVLKCFRTARSTYELQKKKNNKAPKAWGGKQ